MTTLLPGINGVLDGILSPVTERPATPRIARHASKTASPKPDIESRERIPATDHTGARKGRPLGSNAPRPPSKEKVTLQIGTNLIAEYRDWSWDARCHLSHLVEEALADYQRRRRTMRFPREDQSGAS